MSEFSLYRIAPRLACARDERREELRIAAARERHLSTLILDTERLVAHLGDLGKLNQALELLASELGAIGGCVLKFVPRDEKPVA